MNSFIFFTRLQIPALRRAKGLVQMVPYNSNTKWPAFLLNLKKINEYIERN
jgi:hypothetical protein